MTDAEIPVEGVWALDHTADVGLRVEAPDLPTLFSRAASGAMWLALERWPSGESRETRSLDLVEQDLASLLRSWLRALLFWQETEGFVAEETSLVMAPAPMCADPQGLGYGLRARVVGCMDGGSSVREIKGVTLHGLSVAESKAGWEGSVVFDV